METSHRPQHEKSEGAGKRKQQTDMETLYEEQTSKDNSVKEDKHKDT